MKNTYNQFYFTKTEYVKINNQIIDAIKKEDIKIVKNLMPKFYKLQNTLIDLGVKINTINFNESYNTSEYNNINPLVTAFRNTK